MPVLKWLGTWILVMAPVLLYAALRGAGNVPTLGGGQPGSAATFLRGADDIALTLLFALGVFLWPMVALCVAIGGFSSLARIDLIVLTVVRSFSGYGVTVLVVYASFVAAGVVDWGLVQLGSATPGRPGVPGIVLHAISIAVTLYLDIVAMRVIGLFYRHFKRRFAWDWG